MSRINYHPQQKLFPFWLNITPSPFYTLTEAKIALPIMILWTLSGILSCLIYLSAERHSLRHIDFAESLLVVLIIIVLCILGPIGLTILLLTSLVH